MGNLRLQRLTVRLEASDVLVLLRDCFFLIKCYLIQFTYLVTKVLLDQLMLCFYINYMSILFLDKLLVVIRLALHFAQLRTHSLNLLLVAREVTVAAALAVHLILENVIHFLIYI